jgi:hypothetical protein
MQYFAGVRFLLTGEQMFTIIHAMVISTVDEPIRVAAVFNSGKIYPLWFEWHGRQVRVRETAFTWATRMGSASILHFSVADGQGLYEICYNTERLEWKILKVEA